MAGFNMVKKYICFSGEVISKDGDMHKVNAINLPFLYGVNPDECLFVTSERSLIGSDPEYIENLIHLNPKSEGNYYDAKEVIV